MPQLSFEHAALQPSPIALPGPALVPSVPYYGFPDAEPGFELEVPRDVCAAALTAPTDDSIELFALGADRAVWSRTRVAGRWRAWRPLTPQTGAPWATSGPAAAVDASGDVHVLVRGPDGRLWHAQQGGAGTAVEGDGAWSAWSPAGNLTDTVARRNDLQHRIMAFFIGITGGDADFILIPLFMGYKHVSLAAFGVVAFFLDGQAGNITNCFAILCGSKPPPVAM